MGYEELRKRLEANTFAVDLLGGIFNKQKFDELLACVVHLAQTTARDRYIEKSLFAFVYEDRMIVKNCHAQMRVDCVHNPAAYSPELDDAYIDLDREVAACLRPLLPEG